MFCRHCFYRCCPIVGAQPEQRVVKVRQAKGGESAIWCPTPGILWMSASKQENKLQIPDREKSECMSTSASCQRCANGKTIYVLDAEIFTVARVSFADPLNMLSSWKHAGENWLFKNTIWYLASHHALNSPSAQRSTIGRPREYKAHQKTL